MLKFARLRCTNMRLAVRLTFYPFITPTCNLFCHYIVSQFSLRSCFVICVFLYKLSTNGMEYFNIDLNYLLLLN